MGIRKRCGEYNPRVSPDWGNRWVGGKTNDGAEEAVGRELRQAKLNEMREKAEREEDLFENGGNDENYTTM